MVEVQSALANTCASIKASIVLHFFIDISIKKWSTVNKCINVHKYSTALIIINGLFNSFYWGHKRFTHTYNGPLAYNKVVRDVTSK
jgi:hypothetical protein